MLGLCRKYVATAALALALVSSMALPSFAQVTLPDTGVDVGEFITAAITDLGAIVLVAIGGYFAFLLVRKGIRWGRSLMG